VLIAGPPESDTRAGELLQRIRGELLADGFQVDRPSEPVPPDERRATLDRAGRASDAAVAAGLFVDDGGVGVELRLIDEYSGRTLIRRLERPPEGPDDVPQVLARRAVELLRAGLLEFLVASLRAASARPSPVPPRPASEPSTVRADEARWGFELGAGMLASLDGVGPSIVPITRFDAVATRALRFRLTAAWVGTQSRVQGPPGSGAADIDQGVVLLEGVWRFWQAPWVRPEISLGAGGYYVGVNGTGGAGYPGRQTSALTFAADGAVGVAIPVAPHLEIVLEAHAIVTVPGVAIRFMDAQAATLGRPSVLGTLTLAGWI
jgi:hypothetical protein